MAYGPMNSPSYADHEQDVDFYLEASLKRLMCAQWRNRAGNVVGNSSETRYGAAKPVIFPSATLLDFDLNIKIFQVGSVNQISKEAV